MPRPFDNSAEIQRRCRIAHIDVAPRVFQCETAVRRLVTARVAKYTAVSENEVASIGACRTDSTRLSPVSEAVDAYRSPDNTGDTSIIVAAADHCLSAGVVFDKAAGAADSAIECGV
ncbi:hypothetical protein D3C73_668080 [compost metagenome]